MFELDWDVENGHDHGHWKHPHGKDVEGQVDSRSFPTRGSQYDGPKEAKGKQDKQGKEGGGNEDEESEQEHTMLGPHRCVSRQSQVDQRRGEDSERKKRLSA